MTQSKLKNVLARYFPFLLLLLNLFFKALYLIDQDIGLDEPFSIYQAQFDFAKIIEHLKNYNNPPLFELLLHVWIKLFGISPLAVRVLPLIFASLAPVALFYFAKKHFSLFTAYSASLLFSVSYVLQYHAHDCRVYSLFVLLAILSIYFFLELLESERRAKNKTLFAITTTLLIYSHYFGFFILFFQAIYLFLYYRPILIKFFGYYTIILLLYLPHLYTLITRVSDSVGRGTWVEPPKGIESLYNMLWSFSNFPFITVACILILVGALVKYFIHKPFSPRPNVLVLVWFLFPYLGMFIVSFWVPMYLSRYLIFVLPAYYLVIVLSIEYLFNGRPKLKWILSGALIVCFAATLELSPDKKQHVGRIVSLVKQHKTDSTLVLIAPNNFLEQFAYHYNRQYFSTISDGRERHLTDSLFRLENILFLKDSSDIKSLPTGKFDKLIFVGAGEGYNDVDGYALTALNSKYKQTFSENLSAPQGVHIFDLK